EGFEQGDHFADIAPRGGLPDAPSFGEGGGGLALAQVDQGEEGLLAGVELSPRAGYRCPVSAYEAGGELEACRREGDRARIVQRDSLKCIRFRTPVCISGVSFSFSRRLLHLKPQDHIGADRS